MRVHLCVFRDVAPCACVRGLNTNSGRVNTTDALPKPNGWIWNEKQAMRETTWLERDRHMNKAREEQREKWRKVYNVEWWRLKRDACRGSCKIDCSLRDQQASDWRFTEFIIWKRSCIVVIDKGPLCVRQHYLLTLLWSHESNSILRKQNC